MRAKDKPRRLIVDADAFTYTVGSRVMRSIELDGIYHSVFDLADVKADLDNIFHDIFAELKTSDCIICLSDPAPKADWRRAIYPPYKSNRKPGDRPMAYQAVRDELAKRWPVVQQPNMEADDLCGLLSTAESEFENIVVSPDKDLLTLPGFIYNPTHKTLEFITRDGADRNHMLQTLTGDRVDCFPGLPGCGPKKAEKVLAGISTITLMWPRVIGAYEGSGLTEKDALVQAQMAGILRDGQYDEAAQQVTPWSPPDVG